MIEEGKPLVIFGLIHMLKVAGQLVKTLIINSGVRSGELNVRIKRGHKFFILTIIRISKD
ncbi:hypothetical protein GCM10007103_09360 [Salinimicrobium marinum]|uniref:Uncharacterized protein n=1 Tax=Salinimicrobium marinum TaxID=680283 RepID=A0A918S9B6_9FLAO|nr:hypothetical protein [Salinimicrobium marinum]GHA30179.1 hypothetical protein GCM10007103_09360 [Salinimicrobium marinum]